MESIFLYFSIKMHIHFARILFHKIFMKLFIITIKLHCYVLPLLTHAWITGRWTAIFAGTIPKVLVLLFIFFCFQIYWLGYSIQDSLLCFNVIWPFLKLKNTCQVLQQFMWEEYLELYTGF